MLNYEEYVCPVCGEPFGPDDDVVVCPLCGAPHHRGCYGRNGRCAFADRHGTAKQWSRRPSREDDGAVVCGNCGTVNPDGEVVCSKCGRSLVPDAGPRPEEQLPPVDPNAFATPFNPFGDVPPDEMIGGEPAMDLAIFLGSRQGFYLPRFRYLERCSGTRSHTSWNWAAALFPGTWLAYRKLTRALIPVAILSLLLSLPAFLTLGIGLIHALGDSGALSEFLGSGLIPVSAIPAPLLIALNLSPALSLGLRAYMGLMANELYRRHTRREMQRLRRIYSDPLHYRYALSRRGGGSPMRAVVYAALFLLCTAGLSTLLILCQFGGF